MDYPNFIMLEEEGSIRRSVVHEHAEFSLSNFNLDIDMPPLQPPNPSSNYHLKVIN